MAHNIVRWVRSTGAEQKSLRVELHVFQLRKSQYSTHLTHPHHRRLFTNIIGGFYSTTTHSAFCCAASCTSKTRFIILQRRHGKLFRSYRIRYDRNLCTTLLFLIIQFELNVLYFRLHVNWGYICIALHCSTSARQPRPVFRRIQRQP